MFKKISIQTTKKQEIIDITDKIKKIIGTLKIDHGICLIYCPHSTAGIFVNENYDPGVCRDILNKLEELIPSNGKYEHNCIDNNAHAHLKASLIGSSENFIINNKEICLGKWQNISLAEFDGPRNRQIFLKIIEK